MKTSFGRNYIPFDFLVFIELIIIINAKNPNSEISELGFYFKKRTNFYFNPAKLCFNVAILESASASFCLSFAKTFSGAPATNFSLANLL